MATVNLAKLSSNLLKNATSRESVELGSLWQNQTVVIFFLRRFGCQVCRWTAAEVSKLETDLKTNGIALIGVGPEETGLNEFVEGRFFKGDIYIDEKKQCYKDLGFKRYNAINVLPAAMGKKVREVVSKVVRTFCCILSKTRQETMCPSRTSLKPWASRSVSRVTQNHSAAMMSVRNKELQVFSDLGTSKAAVLRHVFSGISEQSRFSWS
ncbi:prostamide/prostaglandin F synthase isoform X1 [Hoplias malabaricus]|uniref:prostamide/prostaglandin F synthase isoform X1 n=1 Tax=Hoplias malabaricus TaxID=27720 RepID=UPI003462F6BD